MGRRNNTLERLVLGLGASPAQLPSLACTQPSPDTATPAMAEAGGAQQGSIGGLTPQDTSPQAVGSLPAPGAHLGGGGGRL